MRGGLAALVVLEQHGDIGSGGNLGPVGILGGNKHAESPVGFLQVGLRHAQHILLGDLPDFIPLVEEEPPIAFRGGLADGDAHRLRVGQAEINLFQDPRFGALDLFLAGSFCDKTFDGLEEDLARFVDRLIVVQPDEGRHRTGVVEALEIHACADGLLIVH